MCPDCRGQVSPDAVCTACGLALTGPLATRLWRAMLTADDLVEQLRAQPVAAAAPRPPPRPRRPRVEHHAALRVPSPRGCHDPEQPAPPARSGLSGRAVPVILLGLGGLFVFVAVSLFLAVTWEVLPLSVKAALMLGFTAAVGGTAAHLSRKGLRGSAEALWALVAALLMLDLRAGYASGLFGLDQLSTRSAFTLAGGLLVALGAGVALWAQRTRITRCVAAECTLVAGVLLVTAVQGWSTSGTGGLREAIAVPVLVGLGLLLRDRLRDASYAVTGIGVLTWVLLAANGVSQGLQAQTRAEFWNGFDGWPLLVAAVYAALVASVRTLTPEVRAVAAGSTLVGLSLLVLLPAEWTHPRGAAPRRGGPGVRRRDPVHAGALVHGRVGARRTVAAGAAAATVLLPAGLALDFADQHEPWSTAPGTLFPTVGDPSPWTLAALVLAPWPSSPPWSGATSSTSACCWRWVRSCWPWPPRPALPAPDGRCGSSWPRSAPSPWSAPSPPS